jgi:hypothetical protein
VSRVEFRQQSRITEAAQQGAESVVWDDRVEKKYKKVNTRVLHLKSEARRRRELRKLSEDYKNFLKHHPALEEAVP